MLDRPSAIAKRDALASLAQTSFVTNKGEILAADSLASPQVLIKNTSSRQTLLK